MQNKIKNLFNNNKKIFFIIPYLVFFLIFVLLPIILLIITTFIPIKNTTENYNPTEVVESYTFWYSFFKSILIGLITSLIALIIALPYVYFLCKTESKTIKNVAISFLTAPLLIFTLVKILALKSFFTFIFDERQLNNSFFLTLGLVYLNLPFMIIPLYSVFSSMPKSLANASTDLGYTEMQTFLKVVIPYGLKSICSGITVVFIMSIMSIAVSDKLLVNKDQNQMIGNIINDLANPANPFDMQKASSVILILFLFLGIIYFSINSIPKIYRKIKGGIDD